MDSLPHGLRRRRGGHRVAAPPRAHDSASSDEGEGTGAVDDRPELDEDEVPPTDDDGADGASVPSSGGGGEAEGDGDSGSDGEDAVPEDGGDVSDGASGDSGGYSYGLRRDVSGSSASEASPILPPQHVKPAPHDFSLEVHVSCVCLCT